MSLSIFISGDSEKRQIGFGKRDKSSVTLSESDWPLRKVPSAPTILAQLLVRCQSKESVSTLTGHCSRPKLHLDDEGCSGNGVDKRTSRTDTDEQLSTSEPPTPQQQQQQRRLTGSPILRIVTQKDNNNNLAGCDTAGCHLIAIDGELMMARVYLGDSLAATTQLLISDQLSQTTSQGDGGSLIRQSCTVGETLLDSVPSSQTGEARNANQPVALQNGQPTQQQPEPPMSLDADWLSHLLSQTNARNAENSQLKDVFLSSSQHDENPQQNDSSCLDLMQFLTQIFSAVTSLKSANKPEIEANRFPHDAGSQLQWLLSPLFVQNPTSQETTNSNLDSLPAVPCKDDNVKDCSSTLKQTYTDKSLELSTADWKGVRNFSASCLRPSSISLTNHKHTKIRASPSWSSLCASSDSAMINAKNGSVPDLSTLEDMSNSNNYSDQFSRL